MAGSFVENINLLAGKLDTIEESNEIFDEGVIPILNEIAQLDLAEAIVDLKKGNYLGNRKIDINLILNMTGVDETLLEREPEATEAIWTDVNKAVHYDKAIITFVDGEVIELPFMFDGSPVTVSTHGDLLAQLARLDYVYAKAQIDSIYQLTVGNSTDYTVTINTTPYTFTSDVVATRENIIAGIANMINSNTTPVNATVTDKGTKLNLTAKIPGNPFFASVSNNMAINTIQANVIEGPVETAFLAKLENTLAANFAEPVVGEIVRLYDVIGSNSNIERIKLNAVSGSYKVQAPEYYWAKTTSAFQTLSMRANDIIKLGNEIDNIILLAKSIKDVIEIQKRIPQLVDTFDENGNPNGDKTIYNNLSELSELYSKLNEIITVYNDIKVGGTNYIISIGQDLQESNTIGIVASDLQLGVDSKIKAVGSNINKVTTVADNITNVNTVASANPKIDLIVNTIVPNINELLLADDNAQIAKDKALEATNAAAVATSKSNEIKNVSVGTTVTGVPGSASNVTYNPLNGKFTFVIPKGDKGDKGDAFNINAVGLKSNQSLYDNMPIGFSFLAVDESTIYFKLSNSTGDWSLGSPFGKGEKGDKGDEGISIVNISRTSGDGTPGTIDTYTITMSDSTTYNFDVHQGKDSDISSIDLINLESELNQSISIGMSSLEIHKTDNSNPHLVTKAQVGLSNVDNTSDTNKPISTATQNALNTKADITYVNALPGVGTKGNQDTTGNADTATKLKQKVYIGGIEFDGSQNINLPGVNTSGNQDTTGNAATATILQTARSINGVLFNGSSNITISDGTAVKLTGDQTIAGAKTFSSVITGSISGNAGSATKLATARTINGVNFDGSANITVSDSNAVKLTGNETITGVKTFSSNIVGNITGSASLNLPLTGGAMTGAITAIRETRIAMGSNNNIILATGNLFTKTITGDTTLTISGALASGNANSFILELTNGGTGVITWWSGMKWAGGTAPTLTTAGVDILGFYSHDGGATWRGMLMAKDSK